MLELIDQITWNLVSSNLHQSRIALRISIAFKKRTISS